jgi:hypothetical protein
MVRQSIASRTSDEDDDIHNYAVRRRSVDTGVGTVGSTGGLENTDVFSLPLVQKALDSRPSRDLMDLPMVQSALRQRSASATLPGSVSGSVSGTLAGHASFPSVSTPRFTGKRVAEQSLDGPDDVQRRRLSLSTLPRLSTLSRLSALPTLPTLSTLPQLPSL